MTQALSSSTTGGWRTNSAMALRRRKQRLDRSPAARRDRARRACGRERCPGSRRSVPSRSARARRLGVVKGSDSARSASDRRRASRLASSGRPPCQPRQIDGDVRDSFLRAGEPDAGEIAVAENGNVGGVVLHARRGEIRLQPIRVSRVGAKAAVTCEECGWHLGRGFGGDLHIHVSTSRRNDDLVAVRSRRSLTSALWFAQASPGTLGSSSRANHWRARPISQPSLARQLYLGSRGVPRPRLARLRSCRMLAAVTRRPSGRAGSRTAAGGAVHGPGRRRAPPVAAAADARSLGRCGAPSWP